MSDLKKTHFNSMSEGERQTDLLRYRYGNDGNRRVGVVKFVEDYLVRGRESTRKGELKKDGQSHFLVPPSPPDSSALKLSEPNTCLSKTG